jgi:hypothetical protein
MTVNAIAKKLVNLAERRDNIVVGPLVWYPADEMHRSTGATFDDRMWTVMVTVPRASGFYLASVSLGIVACEPDDILAAACDTVIVIRRASEVTFDDAQAMRTRLIDLLGKKFRYLYDAIDDLDAAQAVARIWPGERAERILREVTAEKAA